MREWLREEGAGFRGHTLGRGVDGVFQEIWPYDLVLATLAHGSRKWARLSELTSLVPGIKKQCVLGTL